MTSENLGGWSFLMILKPFTSDWDSNPAKTPSTWFQDLTKLRFLMSHCRKNSVRDKVIGKRWIYSDMESSTLQTVWAVAEGKLGHEIWCGSFL